MNKYLENPMKLLPLILRNTVLVSACVLQTAPAAATPPSAKYLAMDSYMFLEIKEVMLDAVVRNPNQADYNRFIWAATQEQLQKWPKDGVAAAEYSDCHHALTSFQTYSKDQFKARGALNKSSPTAQQYFDFKIACERRLNSKR